MAGSLNGNAIYTQYSHFENAGWLWLTDISYDSITAPGNGLIGMVEVFAIRHMVAQYVFAVLHHSRQGPDR